MGCWKPAKKGRYTGRLHHIMSVLYALHICGQAPAWAHGCCGPDWAARAWLVISAASRGSSAGGCVAAARTSGSITGLAGRSGADLCSPAFLQHSLADRHVVFLQHSVPAGLLPCMTCMKGLQLVAQNTGQDQAAHIL